MAPVVQMMVSIFRDEDKMKLRCATRTVFLSLLALCVSYGQAPDGTSFEWKHRLAGPAKSTQVTEDDVQMGLVRNILKAGSPVTKGSVQLHGMGDEAAVILLKILGSMPSPAKWTDDEKKTILEIINRAFEHPKSITNRSNKTPNATNLLLRILNDDTEDHNIKTEISRTRSFAADAASRLFAQ